MKSLKLHQTRSGNTAKKSHPHKPLLSFADKKGW